MAPLSESWVTIHVEGKPIGFMVDTGAQHSVFNQKLDQCLRKPAWCKEPWGQKILLEHRKKSRSGDPPGVPFIFLMIPECPAPLLGSDLLTKVNAQIHFDPGGMTVTDGLRQQIHVLSLALRDKYRLFVPKSSETITPDVQLWVHKYLLAWAEMAGMGLAKQRQRWMVPRSKQQPDISCHPGSSPV